MSVSLPLGYLQLLLDWFAIRPHEARYYAVALSHRSTRHVEKGALPRGFIASSIEDGGSSAEQSNAGCEGKSDGGMLDSEVATHPSVGVDSGCLLLPSNERLEFIGDAVLSLLVKDYLFRNFPDFEEGDMTQICAQVLSRNSLNRLADRLGLTEQLYSFNANLQNQPKRAVHVGGNALEALVAAIYLDLGFDAARAALGFRLFSELVDWGYVAKHRQDPKSRLLQEAAGEGEEIYFDTVEIAPNSGRFISVLYVDGQVYGQCYGSSKRDAERRVSEHYLAQRELGVG